MKTTNTLSSAAKSALSMIFNAPGELTAVEVRRRVREEYGRDVERELRSWLLTEEQ